MSPKPDEPLWTFAQEVYAREGVSSLCLELQDEHGLDVNILLGCLWYAVEHGAAPDIKRLQWALEATAPLLARVRSIRTLRRETGLLRSTDPRWQDTYEHLKRAELCAERMELAALARVLGDGPTQPVSRRSINPAQRAGLALQGLQHYARLLGTAPLDHELFTLVSRVMGGE